MCHRCYRNKNGYLLLDELYTTIYRMKGKTINKQSGFIHKHKILSLIERMIKQVQDPDDNMGTSTPEGY